MRTVVILLAGIGLRAMAQEAPPVAEGLLAHYDARDFEAARWKDRSAGGRHLVAPDARSRPARVEAAGRPVVRFDGADDWMGVPGLGLRIPEATVFAVAAVRENPGWFRAFVSANERGANDYTTGFNLDLGGAGGEPWACVNAEGRGFSGQADLQRGAVAPGFHVLALAIGSGPGGVRLEVDGAETGRRDRAPGVLAIDELRLGARKYSNSADRPAESGFFPGDLAEVLVYGRRLDDSGLAAVAAWLAERHRALLDLPAAARPEPDPITMVVPGFEVRELPVKLTNINNLRYARDGRLFALGYDGRIHALSDADGDGLEETVQTWWDRPDSDLRAPCGLALTEKGLYVTSRGKVSFLSDTDGDGAGDRIETAASGWKDLNNAGVDAIGAAVDSDGNVFFGLITADYTNPYLLDKSGRAHYDIKSERGTVLKLSRDWKSREIFATGIRVPVGIAFNRRGELFVTDQEGATWLPDGNPLDELLHVVRGRHYGFPPRHPKHLPDVIDEPAVVTFGPQHQSACGLVFNEPGPGRGLFGPAFWEGDAIVTGESRGKIWRVPLTKTKGGAYLGRPVLIAACRMLTVDATISPAGDLVVACHSGPPDWGTGPKGEGRLFQIRYRDRDAPQPVVAWPAGPMKVMMAFDRELDEQAPDFRIECGPHVSPADDLEILKPPYKVLDDQRRAPRARLPVMSLHWRAHSSRYLLSTMPHAWNVPHAITEINARDVVHLGYDLHGVEAEFTPAGGSSPSWRGWLPHLDPEVVAGLTQGSEEHEDFARCLEAAGTFEFRTRVRLPRAGLLVLEFPRPGNPPAFSVRLDGKEHYRRPKELELVNMPVLSIPDTRWHDLDITVTCDEGQTPLSLHARVFCEPEPWRVLRPEQLLLPWAPMVEPSVPPAEDTAWSPATAGDWARGRAVFHGEGRCSKCHTVRGEGAAFAPDLSNLVHWDPGRVRREIVEPSASINPEFVSCIVEVDDGRVLTGIVLPDGPEHVKVVDSDATITALLREQIKDLRAGAASVMPKGLDQALGPAKLDDLVTFLTRATPEKPEEPPVPSCRGKSEVEEALAALPAPVDPGRDLRIVLVTGPKDHGPGEHDYPLISRTWSRLLAKAPGVRVGSAFKAPSTEDWKEADVLVLYFMDGGFWTEAVLRDLDAFLDRGGGLVLLHSATISKPESAAAVAERIGLAYEFPGAKYRHGPLELEIAEGADHPILRGLRSFALTDESYWPHHGDAARVEVLAATVEEGLARPMVWTHRRDRGRVFATVLGHYAATFDDPFVRILLLRGIAWSANVPVPRLQHLATAGLKF